MRILIADDSPTALKLLEYVLESMGHEVIPAVDGEQAWSLFMNELPPVIITDWMMPKLSGIDFCRRLRDLETDAYHYLILLTAKSSRGGLVEALEAGADDFLSKPFDRKELAARLVVASRVSGLRQQVLQYERMLPICMYCKKIRDQKEDWVPVDDYLAEQTQSTLSHGVCPDCYERQLAIIRQSRGEPS